MKIIKSFIILYICFFGFINILFAHPGRTDSSGCHTCRTRCSSWGLSSGEYHCHQAKSRPQPKEPIKSTFGANGTGTTRLAPEYKNNLKSVESNIKKTIRDSEVKKNENIIKDVVEKETKPIVVSAIVESDNEDYKLSEEQAYGVLAFYVLSMVGGVYYLFFR